MAQQQSEASTAPKLPANDHGPGAWVASLLITFLAMAAIDIPSRFIFVMPSPGPILLLAVVYSSFTAGTLAGLVSALLVILYAAAFLSGQKPGLHDPITAMRLITLTVTAPVMAVLVGILRRDARRGFIERAIVRSEQRYRSLVSAISQVVWATDADGEVVEFLPTWAEFTGQTFAQMKGRNWASAVHPDDLQNVTAVWNDSLASKTAHENDFRVRRADGEWRYVHARAVPVLEHDGRVREWIGTLTDVTEQHRAERDIVEQKQSLEEANERVRLAMDSAEIGTWDFDPISGELRWSDRCKAAFGLSPDTKLDYPLFLDCLHPDDRARTDQAVQRALDPAGDGFYQIEYRTVWPDGSIRWIVATGRAFFRADEKALRPFRFIGTVLDITNRKQAELNIRQAKEQAEAANRAKDQFLAALSHELRTPLTPVLLMATSLENDLSLSSQTRENIALIRRNVELEARLIDDLLDLTRISRGKLQLHLRPVDPVASIDAALEVCQDELHGKGLKLIDRCPRGRWQVQADSARLQQVFWNLIKNAVKFTPAGGEITVGCDVRDDQVHLSVSDSGIGIDPAILPRIFDAFEQGEDRINRQFGGLGMGLSISKALVEMHGGTLNAHSEGTGRGATFTVTFPAVESSVLAPAPIVLPSPEERAKARPLRILLVEDHDATSHVISLLLRQLNHTVTAAPTIAEARKRADQSAFDLLISDLGLPDGSGLDLMRELRSKFNITGICLSGYGMDRDIDQSREAGFARHLTKPIDFRSLKATIESVTG